MKKVLLYFSLFLGLVFTSSQLQAANRADLVSQRDQLYQQLSSVKQQAKELYENSADLDEDEVIEKMNAFKESKDAIVSKISSIDQALSQSSSSENSSKPSSSTSLDDSSESSSGWWSWKKVMGLLLLIGFSIRFLSENSSSSSPERTAPVIVSSGDVFNEVGRAIGTRSSPQNRPVSTPVSIPSPAPVISSAQRDAVRRAQNTAERLAINPRRSNRGKHSGRVPRGLT